MVLVTDRVFLSLYVVRSFFLFLSHFRSFAFSLTLGVSIQSFPSSSIRFRYFGTPGHDKDDTTMGRSEYSGART